MDLRASYLQCLNILIESEEDTGLLNPDSEEPINDYDDREAEYDHEVHHTDTILVELNADVVSLFTYKMAKKPPFPNTTVARLTSTYGATEFLPALQIFLDHNMPHNVRTLKPNQFDCFDIYNAISILLPSKPHGSDTKHLIMVRATPEHSNGPQKPPMPARFDTAVIIEDEESYEEGQIAGTSCPFYCNSNSDLMHFGQASV
jgi:hypothetical protein